MKRLAAIALLVLVGVGCTTRDREMLAARDVSVGDTPTQTVDVTGDCNTMTVTPEGFPAGAWMYVGVAGDPPYGTTITEPTYTYPIREWISQFGDYGYTVIIRSAIDGDELARLGGIIPCAT